MNKKLLHNNLRGKNYPKYLNLIMALYITALLVVVAMANRFVELWGILVPGGIFIFPVTFLICDIVSEVYGYSFARQLIWVGVISEFIFAINVTIVSHLPYPSEWKYYKDYVHVFDPTIRYVFSGLIGLLLGEFINIYLLAKWKIKLHGQLFWLRSIGAAACGQATLSIIVVFIAFSGKLPINSLIWLSFCGFIFKIIFAIVFAYPGWLIIKFLKSAEGIDAYDVGVNFNPFKLNNSN